MKKTLVLGIAMVSMILSTQLANAKDTFIYGENGNELIVSTLNNDGKTITPKLKYKYQYDDNEKMIEKKAYRWNSELKYWEPLYIITMNSSENISIMDYAEWNKETASFTENQKQNIYYSDSENHLITYTNDSAEMEFISDIH
ncbi:MAG: DUF3836 domain-containing protein [Phocaeicola sp.]|nr:DUF3836 domain-containing protein [Phocaeicola sp.]